MTKKGYVLGVSLKHSQPQNGMTLLQSGSLIWSLTATSLSITSPLPSAFDIGEDFHSPLNFMAKDKLSLGGNQHPFQTLDCITNNPLSSTFSEERLLRGSVAYKDTVTGSWITIPRAHNREYKELLTSTIISPPLTRWNCAG